MERRKTIRDLARTYQNGEKLTMVTCYDYTFARLVQRADIDVILVGDSLGNVIQGHETTIPVEVEDIIYHTRAVVRGNSTALVLADMPFLSYQACDDEGIRNAGRLLKEGGAQAVKLEGGAHLAPMVERMVRAGIPVCGHLGLTPQSVHAFGGFRVQARAEEAADRLIQDAVALEQAGAFMIVVEMIPAELGKRVSEAVNIPIIGIGAGSQTDGQVLVIYDMLGLNKDFRPKFVKHFASLEETVVEALETYRDEVRAGEYPTDDYSF